MTMAVADTELLEEDRLRAGMYDFLGALLVSSPDKDRLDAVAGLTGDTTEIGKAVGALAKLAASTRPATAEREYNRLFIGLGRGELLPFGSFYMTGFLNEKPLARLRADMRRFEIERSPGRFEPEDNIGSLMEMMAGLILGRYRGVTTVDEQRDFWAAHIGPWAGHFFDDLAGAKSAVFYAPVGALGRAFMDVEREAFRMMGSAQAQS